MKATTPPDIPVNMSKSTDAFSKTIQAPSSSDTKSISVEQARVESNKYFPEFNLQDKVIIVTGGGRGLGLTMAEALFQGGANVHCLDILSEPHEDFLAVQRRTDVYLGGTLHYHHVDVRDTPILQKLIADIAARHARIDGLIAAAGVQHVKPALALEYEDIKNMMDINYTAVFMAAQEVGKQMLQHKTPGSIVLVASMSAIVANQGLLSSAYNSSKAGVNQLTKNLAMEWGPQGIRVNSLCPGHIVTPMVEEHFKEEPELKEQWERKSMLGRISTPEEFRGPATFLISDASSYMTGASLVIDGGHTAW